MGRYIRKSPKQKRFVYTGRGILFRLKEQILNIKKMENKINISELLKDCPKGLELDCSIFEGIEFDSIVDNDSFPIRCRIKYSNDEYNFYYFTKHGCWNNDYKAKCVIFPKGKTTWEGFVPPCKFKAGDVLVSAQGNIVLFSHIDSKNIVYYHCIIPTFSSFRIEENTSIGVGRYYECVLANEQQRQRMYDKIKCSGYKYNQQLNKLEKLIKPEFKDGDIVATNSGGWIGITTGGEIGVLIPTYCVLKSNNTFEAYLDKKEKWQFHRLATEEEKQKLFDVIKANGYKWNAETKSLEKLTKFKVGDRIRKKGGTSTYTITDVSNAHYFCGTYVICDTCDNNWELVPNKFDVSTLKPFDKVLVRDNDEQMWTADMFSFYNEKHVYPFMCVGHYTNQCIPYDPNKHLLGTTNKCDDYYKNWK